MFGQYHSKADGQSISKHTNIHPINYKLWKTWFSQVGQCKFTSGTQKNPFSFFLNIFLNNIKLQNHHDKQHTPSES